LPPIDLRWLVVSVVIVFSGSVWRAPKRARLISTMAVVVALAVFWTFHISAADRGERVRTT